MPISVSHTRMSPHIVLQDYSSADFIHKRLVATRLTPQATVNHSTMGKHGSETFVNVLLLVCPT